MIDETVTVKYLLSGGDHIKGDTIVKNMACQSLQELKLASQQAQVLYRDKTLPIDKLAGWILQESFRVGLFQFSSGRRHGNNPRFVPVALCLKASNRWNQTIASRMGHARLCLFPDLSLSIRAMSSTTTKTA